MKRFLFLSVMLLILADASVGTAGEIAGPLDLKGVCAIALQVNPTIASANAGFARSIAALRRSQSALKPSVNISSSYGYIDRPTLFGTTPILNRQTMTNKVELLQPIYSGGQIQAAISSATWTMRSSAEIESATKSQIVSSAATSYLRAKQALEFVEIAASSVRHLQSSRDAAQKLFDSGAATRSDVLRVGVSLAMAKEQAIKAGNDYATALASLKVAIGLSQSKAIELADDSTSNSISDFDRTTVKRRAEVDAAESALHAANAQLRAAKGAANPNLFLTIDFENQPEGSQFPRLTNTVGIGLMAKMNVFDGGQTRATVDEAGSSIKKAQAELQYVNQSVEFQLESAKLAVTSARSRVQALTTQVESAEESFRVIETGYKEGINILTDVLSAESMLTAAKASKLAAIYDLKIAEINLILALGQTDILTK